MGVGNQRYAVVTAVGGHDRVSATVNDGTLVGRKPATILSVMLSQKDVKVNVRLTKLPLTTMDRTTVNSLFRH